LTAISAKPRDNLAFYTGLLGIRPVKKTVNQDDVSAYHLFYADGKASPGAALTFSPVERQVRGLGPIVLKENSAAPADADGVAIKPPVFLADRRCRRATQSRCRNSRSSDLLRSLHRQRAVSSGWGHGGRQDRSYLGLRQRGHPGRVTDAARIAD
jgi:catechol 2,3-dioxygenase-like lactoylglutathione lyase family enzyme